MKSGKKRAIVFQNLNEQNVSGPFTLAQIAATDKRIQ